MMNIYSGTHRRQVGSGILSTFLRGARPFFMKALNALKPHAAQAAKRAAQSALSVGSQLSLDAMRGKLNKTRLKEALRSEAEQLSKDTMSSLKRKLGQEGSGRKRRRLNPPPKQNKHKPKQTQRKLRSSSKTKSKSTSKSESNRKRKSVPKTKTKTKQGANKKSSLRKVNKRSKAITKKRTPRDIFNS